jgi:arabinose-5-phosphate isomerase
MTAIVDGSRKVLGIYTDGDLRRTLEKRLDFGITPVAAAMSRDPRCISADALAVEAVQIMEQYRISQMLVVDADHRLVGALNMFDLLRAKVI